ncbi:MAG: HAD-IA family hydrolase [Paracoccaceae bacterium]
MLQGKTGAGKCVVFDLDGTLADTSDDLLAAANACFRSLGVGDQLTRADQLTAFHGGRAMLRLGFTRLTPDAQPDEAQIDLWYPRLLQAYAEAIDVHTRLYPGAVGAVEELRRTGHAVAICTNKPAGLAEALMRNLGVRDLFDALVGADTLPVRKPDPAPYHLAVRQSGGAARSMLVGDTETDRKTGLAAGVPVALVTFGPEGAGVARLTPDALLERFEDLPDMVARLLG